MASTVHQVFARSSARFPAQPFLHIPAPACSAYHAGAIGISYAEMSSRAASWAAVYAAAGYGTGHRVALALANRPAFFEHWLALNALGASVVLTTSVMNRVRVVEYALPAMLPGILVALKDVLQLSRPRVGYGSDVGGRRTPWIVGGMAVLALGGVVAAVGTAMMEGARAAGIAVAVLGFLLIGLGVGAAVFGGRRLHFLGERPEIFEAEFHFFRIKLIGDRIGLFAVFGAFFFGARYHFGFG